MATWNLLNADDPALARAAINANTFINVKDYEAVGDGVTDDTVAIQSAIVVATASFAAAAAGPVEVFFPSGVWAVTELISVGAGVILRGAGLGATTISGSHASGVITLAGQSDMTIADLTVEATNATVPGPSEGTVCVHSVYNGLQSSVTISGCRLTGATRHAVRFDFASQDMTFRDNIVDNCVAGFTMLGPDIALGLLSEDIFITNNRFRNVGNVNIQLYGPGPESINTGVDSTFHNVLISGNDLRDFDLTNPTLVVPIEPGSCTNLRVSDNVIDGPTYYGLSCGNSTNTTITGNIIRGATNLGVELNGGRHVAVVGNVFEDCATMVSETGYWWRVIEGNGGWQLSDVVIANNTFTGTGRSSAPTVREVIRLITAQRVRISGNVITDWQYDGFAVRLGLTETEVNPAAPGDLTAVLPPPQDCVVEGNTFVVIDANTPIRTITVDAGHRNNIVRNTVRIERDLVAGEVNAIVIGAKMDPEISDTLIEGNHIQFTGSVAAGTSVGGIGNHPGTAAACATLTVRNNHVIDGALGLYLRTNSADLIVTGNETSTCATADSFPATAIRYTNTAGFNFGDITAGSSVEDTLTVNGAILGDCVALGVPTGAITVGVAWEAWVSAANTVTVRAHNYTAGTLNPGGGTFKATIVR